MKLFMTVIACIICFANISYSFEIDGFKDGMAKEKVLEEIKTWNFDKVDDNGDHVSIFDMPNKGTYRHIDCYFHNNQLVGFQKSYKPSMTNYILLFKETGDKNGNNVNCSAQTKLTTAGDNKSITCIWSVGNEEITISYNIFPSNDNLYVYYNAYNRYGK